MRLLYIVQDTNFMPEGGALGFHCNHLYPVSKSDSKIHTACLKGRDAAFLSATQFLGLKGETFALWNANYGSPYRRSDDEDEDSNQEDPSDNDRSCIDDFNNRVVFSKTWHAEPRQDEMVDYGGLGCDDCLDYHGIPCKAPAVLKFVNDRPAEGFRTGLTLMTYGNDPTMDSYYYTAAVIVQITAAKDRKIPEDVTESRKRQKL